MQISLDAYRVFACVARYGSFTKAANALYTNQPNVTRTIKNLERELGCTLFLRTSRMVQLTPEGEALYGHIQRAMDHITAGEEQLLRHTALKEGQVRIGVSENALHHVLLPVLEEFRKQYPGIQLRVLNSNSLQAMTALQERQVDFALVTMPIAIPPRFQARDLLTFQDVPICHGDLARELPEPLTLGELTRIPLISLCKGSATYRFYEDWFASQEIPFQPEIEAATADQIPAMVRSRLGVGFVSQLAAGAAVQSGEIRRLSLTSPIPGRVISLVKPGDMPLSIAAARLEEMLLARFLQESPERNVSETNI